MFAYLDGMIGAKWADALILEVSGVGYRLTAAPGMLERFGKPGGSAARVHLLACVKTP
jgi:Holliday junction resolvasome RuvABC DNA-binding subunit